MTAIVDYGAGNIYSVYTAVKKCGASPFLTSRPADLEKADRIILPGVGAFGDGMKSMHALGLVECLQAEIARGKPFLGICLGLQMLFSWSEEGNCSGLNVLAGKVVRFVLPEKDFTVPHMGWNQVTLSDTHRDFFAGFPESAYFYFAHSYYVCPEKTEDIAGTTEYGLKFTCLVRRGNIVGVQFHPEKSGENGLRFLSNFLKI